MNIRNGNLNLVYSGRVYFANYEPMTMRIDITKKDVIDLIFETKYDGGETKVSFNTMLENQVATIKFNLKNFGTPLGSFLKTPVEVGKVDGRSIKIIFGVEKPSDGMPVLDISVYVEASYGK